MFNLPWVTVGIGVTIPPLRDEVKPDEALVVKVVLLVRVRGGSTLVSTNIAINLELKEY